MMKSWFHGALALATCSLLATAVVAAPTLSKKGTKRTTIATPHVKTEAGKQKVTFEITGADNSQVDAINKALADHNLKAKVHEDKGKGKAMHLTAEVDRGGDLSPWIKAIDTTAAKGKPAPTLALLVFAPINRESGTQALAHLDKVKGVDAKHSTADVKMGELRVRLTGNDHVTPDEISGAVQEAGIVGHFTKMTAGGKKT
jgi:hypothetical protein